MHKSAALAAIALSLGACGAGPAQVASGPVALFTSLPVLWNEAPDLAAILKPDTAPHWARAVLARRGPITPLDTLADAHGLEQAERLVIAQPRPLSPEENVALDRWVRGGGKLLLLADPALTEDSLYALGDRRRRQDVVLLSPILARWGLRLTFDETQPLGERNMAVLGIAIPVNLPGAFVAALPVGGGAAARCQIEAQGLAARCKVGRGTVTALADAAVLERGDDGAPHTVHAAALTRLLEAAFD